MGRDNIRAQNEVAGSLSGSSFVVIYRTAKVSSHEQTLANDKQYETLERIRLDGGETLSDFFTILNNINSLTIIPQQIFGYV